MDDPETLKNIERSLLAILTIIVENREVSLGKIDKKMSKNIEILLANAGFKGPDVAKIVGKNLGAVQKAIQRGRK